MKKVLSLLMMAMLAVGAWAAEESIELTAEAQGYANGDLVTTVQGDVVTLTFDKASSSTAPAYYSTGDAVRLYNGGTMTITAGGNTITQVVFVYELNGSATVSVTPGTYDESTKTWTGSATEVVMTAGTAKHVRISKVTVTYEVGETPAVATPVISGETPFTESTEVTITCDTEGASIYYTLDGTDPTNESTEYTAALTLTETTTVKAIAYDATGAASSVATKEFVKEVPVVLTNVATVAEFKALADDTEFTFTGELVVGAQSGAYLYLQDSTDGMLVYGTIDQTYNRLAAVPGGWTAKKTTFHGAPEAAEPAGFAASTLDVDLAPEEMTIAQITLDNAFEYAVIRGATVIKGSGKNGTIIVGEETVAMYNRFNVDIPTDGNVYDIVGITGYYDAPQFMPLEFVPQGVTVAPPTFNPAAGEVEAGTEVTISAPDAELIIYTTDGTDPSYEGDNGEIYTEPIIVNEAMTIKAIAVDADDNVSAVASAAYTIKPGPITCATVEDILDLEFNTEFTFTGNLIAIAQTGKYFYAQDEEGDGMYFYGTAPAYEKGDVIPGGWSGVYAQYKGSPEVMNITGMVESTETAELTAVEMTPAQVTVDPYNLYHYAVIKGASLGENGAIVAGEESVAGYYDRFGVYFPEDYEGKTFDVYGIPSWYNNAQFIPLEIVEVVETIESTITFEAPENGTIAVTLADGTEVESGVTKVAEGTKVTVAVTANTGYLITGFEVKKGDEVLPLDAEEDGAKDSNAETHTFTMPDGDVSINVIIEEDPSTAIDSINMENVKAVRYYNVAGVESATPFQGVNIVVREMTDGSKSVIKVVK